MDSPAVSSRLFSTTLTFRTPQENHIVSVPFETIEKTKKCFSLFFVSPRHLETIQNLIPGWTTIVKFLKQVKNWKSPSRDPWSNCLINSREDDKGQTKYYSGRQKDNSKTICRRAGYSGRLPHISLMARFLLFAPCVSPADTGPSPCGVQCCMRSNACTRLFVHSSRISWRRLPRSLSVWLGLPIPLTNGTFQWEAQSQEVVGSVTA